MNFIQYLRPYGQKKQVVIVRPELIEAKATELETKGYRFEIEELMSGMVSMTVEYPKGHELSGEAPLEMQVCMNGEKIPETVDKLITTAHNRIKKVEE